MIGAVLRAVIVAAKILVAAIKAQTEVGIVAEVAAALAVAADAVAVAAAVADVPPDPEVQPVAATCRRRNTLRRKAESHLAQPILAEVTISAANSLVDSNRAVNNLAASTIAAPRPAHVPLAPSKPARKTKSFSRASRSQSIAANPRRPLPWLPS